MRKPATPRSWIEAVGEQAIARRGAGEPRGCEVRVSRLARRAGQINLTCAAACEPARLVVASSTSFPDIPENPKCDGRQRRRCHFLSWENEPVSSHLTASPNRTSSKNDRVGLRGVAALTQRL